MKHLFSSWPKLLHKLQRYTLQVACLCPLLPQRLHFPVNFSGFSEKFLAAGHLDKKERLIFQKCVHRFEIVIFVRQTLENYCSYLVFRNFLTSELLREWSFLWNYKSNECSSPKFNLGGCKSVEVFWSKG